MCGKTRHQVGCLPWSEESRPIPSPKDDPNRASSGLVANTRYEITEEMKAMKAQICGAWNLGRECAKSSSIIFRGIPAWLRILSIGIENPIEAIPKPRGRHSQLKCQISFLNEPTEEPWRA